MALAYTEEQRRAIQHRNGNLLILACAGSGKTEVVSRRIAGLVEEQVQKSAIIALTFTERAAGELKARIRRHLDEVCPEDPSLGDMYVGTIHSFCLQILKEIDPHYRNYEVMDEARQAALIMTQFHRYGDGRGIGLDRLRSRTRGGRYWETVRTFLTTMSVLHQRDVNGSDLNDEELDDCVRRYQEIAYGPPNYFFDFDRIIGVLIECLRNDAGALELVRSRFRHIVVDEYQDVDDRQEELIHLITDGGRRVQVTAVGDDDQAIYGWRGAQIRNILTFSERYPDVHTVKLVHNFRSTHAIVEIGNAAIRVIPPGRRSAKDMEASHWTGDGFEETLAEQNDVQIRTLDDEHAEAEWVADRIRQLRGTIIREKDGSERAIDWADMAILLRSVRSAGAEFVTALRAADIPVVVKGTGGLFDHDEVVVVYAAFCLLARTNFMLNTASGMEMLEEPGTRKEIRTRLGSLKESGLMPLANESLFLEWIAAKREELDRRNLEKAERGRLARRIYPQDIFQEMLSTLGAARGTGPWPQEVLYNLGRFSSLLTQFEAVHQWVTPRDLNSLCIFLGGWAAGQVDQGGLDEALSPNAVQIMTIHSAKGLEWPVVFIPRVSSSNFPSSFRNRGPETFIDPSVFDPSGYAAGDDGERRLWYVALTRCRKFLNVTSPDRRRKRPTEFFKEISHSYIQKRGEIEDRPKGSPTPPADVELLPTTYSDLSYWWRCPFEYQLRSLMGFGPGVKESYGYGQQIHNVLAEIHKRSKDGKHLSPAEVLDLIDARFHLRYTRDGEVFKPFTALRDAAKKTLKLYLESYPDNSKYVLDAEKPFEFVDQESGALISGTIDLLQRLDEKSGKEIPVAVVDFKTHRWKDVETFTRAKAEVENQLLLYAVAAKKALGFDAQEARAHFLNPRPLTSDQRAQGLQDMFSVDVAESRQAEIRTRVQDAVHEIRTSIATEVFPLRGCQSGHCKHCDYRAFCPGYTSWKKAEKTIPHPRNPEEERAAEMRLTMEDVDAGNSP